MATFFMGLTTSHSPLGSPAPSPSPLKSSSNPSQFVHPPLSSPSPAPSPSSKVKSPSASAPAPVRSPQAISPVPEISPASISLSPSSDVAPEPATNAAVTFNINIHLAVGSVAAVICAFAFLA
ncbi:hypothetical protein HAX54_000877 [Datura stramonium]|uniref:Uncharacterized protein n=1 Tax=Datura stramonium TaxID=4076 RepID=A0ABS8RSQ5_DATST|nr:hypothetical protein [Datura stramonium]